MPIDRQAVLARLRQFDFTGLFTQELGWDWFQKTEEITKDGQTFRLTGLAEKRGVQVFHCPPDATGRIPPADTRCAIERELTRRAREHLLIFTDAPRAEQLWLYTRREQRKPIRQIPYRFDPAKSNELLVQKLAAITFTLNEEEGLTLLGVVARLKDALDRDAVTKSFYQRFERERLAFHTFLRGIPDDKLQRWYVAVLLNRLMFIYFIQQKGFLGGGDERYLQRKLATCQGNYYRDFLCPLFFSGFALRENDRPPAIRNLLGQVPFLNGGIFQRHQIEELHGQTLQIANAAFETIFAFFDQYRWHLDERPLANDKEIDPSVLGLIFEKYINAIQPGEQKAKGAYYTKEDITGYISQNTIIPFLFDAVENEMKKKGMAQEFRSAFGLLAKDPDHYIYPAVRYAVDRALPPEIAVGLDTAEPGLIERRKAWNKTSPPEYALPTEIWREVVARHQRYEQIKSSIHHPVPSIQINDLITLNLDIRQFAQDVIENCASPDLLRAFWHAIEKVTVLDPTCGSGAFLFAALNILEPLYEACLDRMADVLEDEAAKLDRAALKRTPHGIPLLPHGKFEDFSKVLDRVAGHPNREYFIFRSIILNNLFGVDIMEEAVEICKLRLFLKLAAQIEPDPAKPNLGIEPLPDIDFNIRAGNTLVGYANADEVETAAQTRMAFGVRFEEVQESVEKVDRLFKLFHEIQEKHDVPEPEFRDAKVRLKQELAELAEKLNAFLADHYGKSPKEKAAYQSWLETHRPFHWFVEFHGILNRGGFDVIIGNPPYVEYVKVKSDYAVQPIYHTLPCGNLYSLVLERSYALARKNGWVSLIVPLSLVCTSRTEEVRDLVRKYRTWISCYDMRPSSLFEGVAQRLCIVVSRNERNDVGTVSVGGYRRWASAQRPHLISLTRYLPLEWPKSASSVPKFDSPVEKSVLAKIAGPPLGQFANETSGVIYVHRIVRYFVKALNFLPVFLESSGQKGKSEDYKEFRFDSEEQDSITALLDSTLFYWFWRSHCDGFHCGYNDVFAMPYKKVADSGHKQSLKKLLVKLMKQWVDTSALKKVRTKAGDITYQEFYPAPTKLILDEIDRVLARHYGLTEEELDFLLNYDIKYRLGLSTEQAGRDTEENE